MKQAQIMGFVQSTKINPSHGYKNILKKIRKAKSLNEKYEIVKKTYKENGNIRLSNPIDVFNGFDKQLQKAGIFSLTNDPLNQLMWAYYGESSKGLALGFSVDDSNVLGNSDKCLKVEYTDDIPEFSSNGFLQEIRFYSNGNNKAMISFEDPTFKKAISTKSTFWKHENEWRYINEGSGTYPFPGEISEIIFGLKISNENRKKYYELAKNLSNFDTIKFYNIQRIKNKNEFELTPAANIG